MPQPEIAKTDAPKKTELTPVPKEDPAGLRSSRRKARRPKVAGWVFAGGAAAGAGVAIAFGVMSGSAKAQYDAAIVELPDGTRGTTLPEDQARSLANQANTNASVALTSGLISAGLAAAATIFLPEGLKEKPLGAREENRASQRPILKPSTPGHQVTRCSKPRGLEAQAQRRRLEPRRPLGRAVATSCGQFGLSRPIQPNARTAARLPS